MVEQSSTFPKRAFIQVFDDILTPESELVIKELEARKIPFTQHRTEEIIAKPLPLTTDDLVVGDFDWTRMTLKQLGIAMPTPPDYPECLKHLLRRKIWQSTLGDVETLLKTEPTKVFIKPAIDTKAFSGLVATSEDEWINYLLE